MDSLIVTGVVSGCWVASGVIILAQYGFDLITLGLTVVGAGVFMMNIAKAVAWYDEGVEVEVER